MMDEVTKIKQRAFPLQCLLFDYSIRLVVEDFLLRELLSRLFTQSTSVFMRKKGVKGLGESDSLSPLFFSFRSIEMYCRENHTLNQTNSIDKRSRTSV